MFLTSTGLRLLVSIHSRLFKPGECTCKNTCKTQRQFQSTPDYLNRENSLCASPAVLEHRFQSTPDYLNRENLLLKIHYPPQIKVSIHSRLFKPGEFAIGAATSSILLFQSTPDYLNRENFRPLYCQRMTEVSIHSRLFKPGE